MDGIEGEGSGIGKGEGENWGFAALPLLLREGAMDDVRAIRGTKTLYQFQVRYGKRFWVGSDQTIKDLEQKQASK